MNRTASKKRDPSGLAVEIPDAFGKFVRGAVSRHVGREVGAERDGFETSEVFLAVLPIELVPVWAASVPPRDHASFDSIAEVIGNGKSRPGRVPGRAREQRSVSGCTTSVPPSSKIIRWPFLPNFMIGADLL